MARQALPSNSSLAGAKARTLWSGSKLPRAVRAAGGRLLTLWGADDRDRDGRFRVYAAYLQADGHRRCSSTRWRAERNPTYPSLVEFFPSALRMERAIFDLLGIRSMEADHRGWLRHGGWPEKVFPLPPGLRRQHSVPSRIRTLPVCPGRGRRSA